MTNGIDTAARGLIERAVEGGVRVVLAESCTGGAVAAALTAVPGASRVLCGSFVTYTLAAKRDWLGVPAELLEREGTVSAATSAAMAAASLRVSPEADVALAVTGHLGPDSEPELDGVVFIAIERRAGLGGGRTLTLRATARAARQSEAVERCLITLDETIAGVRSGEKIEGRDAGSGRE